MDWARMLAYVTGTVDQLLARNQYLTTENRILKDQLKGPTATRLNNSIVTSAT
jgi:hypothetical protein